MRHSVRMEKGILYTAAVLVCLVLVSFWMMCNVYARYTVAESGEDNARVAIFGHSQSIQLSDENGLVDLVPGDSVTYTVTVANYNGATVSEVACKYALEIVTTGNLPLQYEVSKQNDASDASDMTVIDSFLESTNKTKTISTDAMHFEAGSSKEDTYQIKVTWPESSKDAKYAGMPDDITVNVQVEQVD